MRFGNLIQGEQAEAAGQAVMLGTDGKIPAGMLPATGSGQTVTEFTSMADMCDALSDAPSGTTFAFQGIVADDTTYEVRAFGMIVRPPKRSNVAISGIVSGESGLYLPYMLVRNSIEVSAYSLYDMGSISIPVDGLVGVIVQPSEGGGEPRAETTSPTPEALSSYLSSDLLAGVVA